MFFKRVLNFQQKQKLKLAHANKRNPERHTGRKPHPLSVEALQAQSRYHNDWQSSRKIRLPSVDRVRPSRTEFSPYQRDTAAIIRRQYLEKRRREKVGLALLQPDHGCEPYLPDPEILKESYAQLVNTAKSALKMGIAGGEFWRQFWNHAVRSVDVVQIEELVELLKLCKKSQSYQRLFLYKSIREIVEDNSKLTLDDIASILDVYAHFNCFSSQLLDILTDRAASIIFDVVDEHKAFSSIRGKSLLKLAAVLLSSDQKPARIYDLDTVSSILESCHALQYKGNSATIFVTAATSAILECQLSPNMPSICRYFAALANFTDLLTPVQQCHLSMRAQLLVSILPERPPTFDASVWLNGDNLSDTVDVAVKDIAYLFKMIIDFNAITSTPLQPDVRDILAFNLASTLRHQALQYVNRLSPVSPYLSQFPFSAPPTFYYHKKQGASRRVDLDITPGGMEELANLISMSPPKPSRLAEIVIGSGSKVTKQVFDKEEPLSVPPTVDTSTESADEDIIEEEMDDEFAEMRRSKKSKRRNDYTSTENVSTSHKFLSSDLVTYPAKESSSRAELFLNLVTPALSSIVSLWKFLAPQKIGNLLPDPNEPQQKWGTCSGYQDIRFTYLDATRPASALRFMQYIEVSPYDLFVISAANTAVLKYGPYAMAPEGLCLMLEATAMKALASVRSLDVGLNYLTQARNAENFAWLSETKPDDSGNEGEEAFAGGITLSVDEMRVIEMCCHETVRKWAAFSPAQKYRFVLHTHVTGFKNVYLSAVILRDAAEIKKGGFFLRVKPVEAKANFVANNDGTKSVRAS